MNQPNRREMLKWSARLAGGIAGARLLDRPLFAADEKPRKVLLFTKSSSYEHSVIKRKGDALGYAEKLLIDWGKRQNVEIVATKDGRLFEPENLAGFDGFIFYTCGDLMTPGLDKQPPMSARGKQAMLDAVQKGAGFVGLHCASDTFHSTPEKIDPYIAMLGGEFIIHGKQQKSESKIADAKFSGLKDQPDFTLNEEWYALKNFADDLHVILTQQTSGMTGEMYQRPAYPSTWARKHGDGRVFYTSMGHREDVWANPIFQNLLLGGLSWSLRALDADVTPNLNDAAPGARKIPTPATAPAK